MKQKIPIRSWMRENNLKPEDMRQAYRDGKFYSLVVATRAFTTKESTHVQIEGTCYSHVVVEKKD